MNRNSEIQAVAPSQSFAAKPSGKFHLRLLGAFALFDPDGNEVPIAAKKSRALLAILAMSPMQRATRERLSGMLWGDRAQELAQSCLRQSLRVLRKDLGVHHERFLKTNNDVVAIQTEHVDIDTLEFCKHAAAADLASLRRAAEIHSGRLLDDAAVREDAFEDWLSCERRRIDDRLIHVLDRLCGMETGYCATEAARRLVDMDPLRGIFPMRAH